MFDDNFLELLFASAVRCNSNDDSNMFFVTVLSFPVDPDILNGAYMSEALNEVFIDNFQKDPTLTWQYFGSSTGFFRLYPGKSSSQRLFKVPPCIGSVAAT